MVRELLDRETESATKGHGSEINWTNYDFVFLGERKFGIVPEYVLRIVPKRKDKYFYAGRSGEMRALSVSVAPHAFWLNILESFPT